MYVILSIVTLVAMVVALVDIITRDESQVKHLPKVFWIILVILLPLIGSVLWFGIGREYAPRADRGTFGDPRRWERPAAPAAVTGPSQTEIELARLEDEIAEAERQDRIRRLERELEDRRRDDDPA